MYRILTENFSAEYDATFESVLEIIQNGSGDFDAAFAQGFEMSRGLVATHGQEAMQAPIEDLRAHLGAYREMITSMASAPLVCAKLAYNGGGALSPQEAEQLDAQIFMPPFASTLKLILKGRDAKAVHAPVGPTDIGLTLELWAKQTELSQATRKVFEFENWRDPRFCEGWSDYLGFVQQLETPLGERAVAFWVRALIGVPAQT